MLHERPARSSALSARRAAAPEDLANVSTWIFDLDGTLYRSATGIEDELLRRVVMFLARLLDIGIKEAAAVHREYFGRFGATLQAVVQLHGVRPADFLDFVHDVDLSGLRPDPELARAIGGLSGRKLVFTNGSSRHAENVLGALGISDLFAGIGHIESGRFVGKPNRPAYEGFIAAFDVDAREAAMFEDRAVNLAVSRELGMRTILVVPPDLAAPPAEPILAGIDHITDDLTGFLSSVSRSSQQRAQVAALAYVA